MPIIGNVGRKSFKVRALNITIHVVLIFGAFTMLYPFAIMVSGSFKSKVDSKVFSLYPTYFVDSNMLFRKYIEARNNENTRTLKTNYKNKFDAYDYVTPPVRPVRKRMDDWVRFCDKTKDDYTCFDYQVSEQSGDGIYPRNNRVFANILKKESDGSLERFNTTYNSSVLTWDEVNSKMGAVLSHPFTKNFAGYNSGLLARYDKYARQVDLWMRLYLSLDGDFMEREFKQAFAGDLIALNKALGTDYAMWKNVHISELAPEGPVRKYWEHYVRDMLNINHINIKPEGIDSYREFLKNKHGDIASVNAVYNSSYDSFNAIPMPNLKALRGAALAEMGVFIEAIIDAKYLAISGIDIDYGEYLKREYNGDLAALNKAHETSFATFEAVPLSHLAPAGNLKLLADWSDFVKSHADIASVIINPTAQNDLIEYLKTLYSDKDGELDLAAANKAMGTSYKKVINIYPAKRIPVHKGYNQLWTTFMKEVVDVQHLAVDVQPEMLASWHKLLKSKYATIEELSANYGMTYSSFATVPIDLHNSDYFIFTEHESEIFKEFVGRNYSMVMNVMLYNGRAIYNTILYCILAITSALLVNPIAAYAMSRFKLPTSYKILLILMLTMAFPPMVMGIPNFLMMKRLGMLNTFYALILPGMANGYFIFLLKGFFDSLPRELFECATLDGASEWQIFWHIAMSLSKPIMAVIALNAFNLAYRNFMFAFIVCQDKRMWTMMVHIYQLMQRSSQGVGFAALVIAAIPTFLVFVFCQNIIIRGIVVPTEK